jgi:ergothioneine biosynthesis protein EgtB
LNCIESYIAVVAQSGELRAERAESGNLNSVQDGEGMATSLISNAASLRERYRLVRQRSITLCKPLTPEDMMVQSCPEASPAKWHMAHTAWFFESFVAREFFAGYQLFNADFPWLFNSYYQTFAEFPDKRLRASFSRPGLDQVFNYRQHVDAAIDRLLEGEPPEEALRRIELGLHHEEQHQELLLTDIKHALFTNPLQPAYLMRDALDAGDAPETAGIAPLEFLSYNGGLVEIGQREDEGFGFDNERPRHRVWLEPFRLASRLITCGEFAEFMADGGYQRPELWLSAGWDTVREQNWQAPLYWRKADGEWIVGSLRGKRTLRELADAPVAHVSFFEADAYAHWRGFRLPTEAEWETTASSVPIEGNLLETGCLEPVSSKLEADPHHPTQLYPAQLFGDCWEWTSSAYLGYPGFSPLAGALGEYNGKFMSGQMVLRGGSCVTPAQHIRASYRNFFPPETRWQFSGIRLATS